MRTYRGLTPHSEPIETYSEYKEKIEESVLSSIRLNLRKIKNSSLSKKDREQLLQLVKDEVNQ